MSTTFLRHRVQFLVGIGIFANGFLEGLYTGGDLSAEQLQSMTVYIRRSS